MTIEKKMYDMKVASDALAKSTGGLQSAMNSLANSKLLGIISRMASGIFPTFWALQNKIRAGFTIIDQLYKRQGKSTKEALEAMEELVNLSDMSKAMKPFEGLFDMDFSSLDIETAMNSEGFQIFSDEFIDMNNMYDKLKENMKGFEAIEFSLFGKDGVDKNNLEDMVELLETTQDLIKPQKDEMTKRQDEAIKARKEKKKIDKILKDRGIKKTGMRAKIVEKQIKVFDFFTKIRKGFKGFITSGWAFFKTAMKWFAIVTLTLFAIVTAFRALKEPLGRSFESISEAVMFAVGAISKSLEFLLEGFGLIYEGFENGNFLQVVGGLLQVGFGIIGVVLTVLGSILVVLAVTIFGTLKEIFFELAKGGNKTVNTLGGILIAIGLVMGALTYLGLVVYSLPAILAFTLGGIILSLIKPFSTGGIVNSDTQIVGERGAELVSLPRGSRVHSNADSKRMLGSSGGNTINVHVNGRVGASDAEIRDIANKVAREINLRMSRTGSGVNNF
tara:strand:- start:577 stop:2085 length:1509 start_codon:yes stop_codon:yes gene_type:complete